jgi:hypothetical protein
VGWSHIVHQQQQSVLEVLPEKLDPRGRGRGYRYLANEYWNRFRAVLAAVKLLASPIGHQASPINEFKQDALRGCARVLGLGTGHLVPDSVRVLLDEGALRLRGRMRRSSLRKLLEGEFTDGRPPLRGAAPMDSPVVAQALAFLDVLESLACERAEDCYQRLLLEYTEVSRREPREDDGDDEDDDQDSSE